MKQRLTDLYNRYIVKGWYEKWSVWAAGVALILPDLLQAGLDHMDTLFVAVPLLDDAQKAQLRMALIVVTMVLRALKQKPKDAP